jgi:probable selenium-dependent hydroxylase accessory protein YqeC
MTDVLDGLGVQSGDCVAVAGAGGKTTLCWRMVQALVSRGERAVFTTATKIWQPAAGAFDITLITPHPSPLPLSTSSGQAGEGSWKSACIAAAIEGAANNTPVPHAGMPTVQTKLIGYSPDEICALHSTFPIPRATFIVEADGARGLRLKAPGDNEPLIPPCADVVCVVASLDAIGRPLDDRTVHRAERVSRITRAMPGSMITPTMIVEVLCHAEGGMKGMPATARRVAVLTQHSAGAQHPDAARMLAELRERGYHHALVVS